MPVRHPPQDLRWPNLRFDWPIPIAWPQRAETTRLFPSFGLGHADDETPSDRKTARHAFRRLSRKKQRSATDPLEASAQMRGRHTRAGEVVLSENSNWTAALEATDIAVKLDEPLVKKTWWRVGGPAEAYAEIRDAAGLARTLAITHAHDVPVFVLGNASNLLIGDGGIPGLVVRLTGALAELRAPEPGTLVLGGGLKLVGLLRQAQREGYTGLEMIAGVPGTVGGAVRMNAGTRLGEFGDRVRRIDVLRGDGTAEVWHPEQLAFAYRHCALPTDAIVTTATVALTDADPADSRAAIAEHLDYRARTQPTDVPTCGSTFRNPPGDSAGRLVEAAGLKGFAVGQAQVSEKHANFVVNTGGATAADIRTLIETVQARVEARFGIALRREVHYAGSFPERAN